MKEMLPRERFIRTLRHEPVDRVPVMYRMKHEAKEKLARVYGIKDAATGRKHNPELELRLGNDAIIYQIGINADFSHRRIAIGLVQSFRRWLRQVRAGNANPRRGEGLLPDPGFLGSGKDCARELPEFPSDPVDGRLQELHLAGSG